MKIALVTGVGRREGIGFETVRQLGQLGGFHAILSARKSEQAEALSCVLREEKLDVSALQLDTTDVPRVDHAVRLITESYGKLDVLINNAQLFYGISFCYPDWSAHSNKKHCGELM